VRSAALTQLVFVLFSLLGDFFSKSGLDFDAFRNRFGRQHPISKSGPLQMCSVPLGPLSIAKFLRKLLKSSYIMAFELREKILDRNPHQSSSSEDGHVALDMR